MLILSTNLENIPLSSVRSSARIGVARYPIINPNNLHIDAFMCESVHAKKPVVLLDMFVRDISTKGIIIDDHANLSDPADLVRLQPILELNFSLIGKTVKVGKQKIGKVAEYALELDSLFIQKLYVQPPLWKGLASNRLTFDRLSVVEVTDTYIVVSGPEEKIRSSVKFNQSKNATSYSASTSLMSENE